MNEFVSIDNLALENLKYYMPENDNLRQLADVFSLFSDVTRLKILSALSVTEMCVNDLSKYLQINQTTISHQLRYLKSYNLVIDKREGKSIKYSLATDFACKLLGEAVDYIC